MEEEVNASIDNIADLGISVGTLESNLDQFLLIIMGLCLLFMQSGFALVEAGSVRSKNVTNILIKNVCDSYWCQLDCKKKVKCPETKSDSTYGHVCKNRFTFTATASTIVSGAMSKRCEFMAYFIFSFIMTGFIYPPVTHWTWWHNGFLFQGKYYGGEIGRIGYRDFSGSGVVHTVGGTAAFVGAAILGPRIGRFDPVTGAAVYIRGHSIPLSTLGGFILCFGFLTFNGASQLSISKAGDGEAISLAIVNTMITATFASFTATFVYRIPRFGSGAWCINVASNGAITGMFLGWQLAGMVVIMCWTAFWSAISFGIMRRINILRVPEENELKGVTLTGRFSIGNIK